MISANIITLNEESNIGPCIDSVLQVCDEVIVVDSGSVDKTVEIAESKGAKVVFQKYLGDGFQKNIANEYVKNKWILSIDADERLTPEAVKSVNEIDFENASFNAYAFRRRNMIGSRWIRQCGWYPDFCVRLYNKDKCQFKKVEQHSSIETDKVKFLDADLIHYSFSNIGELFAKPGRNFSGRAAKILYKKGKKVNAFSPFLHGSSAFLKKYFLQRGFLEGVDGMTVSISAAISSYLKYAKLLEYYRDSFVREKEDFNKIW
ncbi:glycosyltransferase family 2 protein [Vreelandella rituensis]|uniref:Glycosyltransferase family 2 protein n=1 Tax=Vreelandella rituensis TaxID=2282306 RepID=A0A368U5P3_9GAMM|nr:glycosyltransferase family 2 protein [Halomonas rituensis]RCV92450.1 glycosyltransferase family 2 protein [Halomonas rituensis]